MAGKSFADMSFYDLALIIDSMTFERKDCLIREILVEAMRHGITTDELNDMIDRATARESARQTMH